MLVRRPPILAAILVCAFAWGDAPDDCTQIAQLGGSDLALASFQPEHPLHKSRLLPAFDAKAWAREWSDRKRSEAREAFLKETYQWLGVVVDKLVKTPASGPEKVVAFEEFLVQIAARTELARLNLRQNGDRWSEMKLEGWTCRKADVGGGIQVFWGDGGQILEFHPDGSIYRARVGPVGRDRILSASWKPPYHPDGTPIGPPAGLEENSRLLLVPR